MVFTRLLMAISFEFEYLNPNSLFSIRFVLFRRPSSPHHITNHQIQSNSRPSSSQCKFCVFYIFSRFCLHHFPASHSFLAEGRHIAAQSFRIFTTKAWPTLPSIGARGGRPRSRQMDLHTLSNNKRNHSQFRRLHICPNDIIRLHTKLPNQKNSRIKKKDLNFSFYDFWEDWAFLMA